MTKHSKKRQRLKSEKEPKPVVPLGSKLHKIYDDAEKDEEEKRLEALLFGKFSTAETTVDTDRQENVANGGLSNLLDSDLFVIDEGADSSAIPEYIPSTLHNDTTQNEENGEETGPLSNIISTASATAPEPEAVSVLHPLKSSRTAAAWADPDDANIHVNIATDKRLRKLRDAPTEEEIGGRDYEARLRRQYV